MAHSSLLGIDRTIPAAPGHDTASLGPSDSSDSGSDVAGVDNLEGGDPNVPVDVSVAADSAHPQGGAECLGAGTDTDTAGTGERRSAGGDGGSLAAPDITPDRIVRMPELSSTLDELDASLVDDETREPGASDIAQAVDSEDEDDEDARSAADRDAAREADAKPRKRALRRPVAR